MPRFTTVSAPIVPSAGDGSPAPSQAAKPQPARFWVEVIEDRVALAGHRAAWDDLAGHSVERNAFFEPWMLLPALDHLRGAQHVQLALVFKSDGDKLHPSGQLIGLFPFKRLTRYKGLPLGVLQLWNYGEYNLCTPLIRQDAGAACLNQLLDWLAEDRRAAPLLELLNVPGEGPFAQLLVDVLRSRGTLHAVADAWTRGLFRPRSDGEAYLQAAVSANKRRDLQRKQRRLAEQGAVEFRLFQSPEEIASVLDDFLRLEASGWKGRAGTALALADNRRAFFRAFVEEGAGRMFVHGLYLGGRPIAMRWNLVSPPGLFFFKPGYDEAYSAYSPGVHVELETIRYLHGRPDIAWMDSCTDPDNELINTLWLDRKIFQSLVIAPGRQTGRLAISALPMLRWLKRLVRHR